MDSLFTGLTEALSSSPIIALGAAFMWGVLSIVLSPCHLASIPLIVANIATDRDRSQKKAIMTATMFALGILLSILIVGGITAALGRVMGDIGNIGNYAVAFILLFFGLHLMDIIDFNFTGVNLKREQKGLFGAFVLGLVFGIALGPCTFAFMAPVLGVVFQVSQTSIFMALMLVLLFAIGHSLVLVIAGSSVQIVQKLLNLNNDSRSLTWLRRICGLLVVLAGLYLIWKA